MWRFRKSFSPLPGVRLTLSPSGISTSVGQGPFRVTAGPRGHSFTATVPGTGLSFHHSLSKGRNVSGSPRLAPHQQREPSPVPFAAIDSGMIQIQSSGSAGLTTPGIAEFRKLLDRAKTEHTQTALELTAAKSSARDATEKHLGWKNGWLLRRVMKVRFAALESAAVESKARQSELEEQEKLARLTTQFEIPEGLKTTFSRFSDAFAAMSRSNRIWDTVSQRAIHQVSERTLAARAIGRKPVQFRLGQCTVIQSDWSVPHLENANGGDIFLFPLFVVYFADDQTFALLEYKEVQFFSGTTRFHEEEGVPADSQVVGKTWAKTNKDGMPDRRYNENYEIPIAEYGRIVFKSSTGLNEEYMVSNVANCQAFATEWNALLQSISSGV